MKKRTCQQLHGIKTQSLTCLLLYSLAASGQLGYSQGIEIPTTLATQHVIKLPDFLRCLSYNYSQDSPESLIPSDASTLSDIVSHNDIYIFAHGFHSNVSDGRPSWKEVERMWSGHLAILKKKGKPFVACLFRFDTHDGFGDHQPELGDFLIDLQELGKDISLHNQKRQITLVGHSNGGNFIKHGMLRYQKRLNSSHDPHRKVSGIPMRIIFLATPHSGTPLTQVAKRGVALYTSFLRLVRGGSTPDHKSQETYRQRTKKITDLEKTVSCLGTQQLEPSNEQRTQMANRFSRIFASTGRVEMLCLYSPDDEIVPESSGKLSGSQDRRMPGLSHGDFLKPQKHQALKSCLREVYGGIENTRLTNDAKTKSHAGLLADLTISP